MGVLGGWAFSYGRGTPALNSCRTPGAAGAKAKGGGVMGWMANTLGRGRDSSAKELLAREDLFPRDAPPSSPAPPVYPKPYTLNPPP